MKLRIRGNSIRLRLTKGEVARLAAGDPVSETVELSPTKLVYELFPDRESTPARATFDAGRLRVSVPAERLKLWALSDAVGIEEESGPRILIEKDFACAKPRAGEDDSDMFDNPAEETQC